MASSGWPTCVALLAMVVLLNVSRMSEGTLILVGEDKGWTDKGVDYVAWAAAHKVHVGDSVGEILTWGFHFGIVAGNILEVVGRLLP